MKKVKSIKKVIYAGLALSSLLSFSACGGQAQIVPTAGVPQQGAQAPYLQNAYAYQAPAATPQQVMPQLQQQSAPTTRISASGLTTPSRTIQSAPRTGAPVASVARPAAQPAAAPAPSADQLASQLITSTIQKFDELQNLSLVASVYEKNEKGVTNLKLKMNFQKPTRNKLEILQHNNNLFVGAKLVYESGTDQLTGRPGGMMSFMKMTLPLSDERVTSRRGYRLDQVDTMAIINRLLKSGIKPRVLGKANVNGREVAMLEFTGAASSFDAKITREVLGIDMQDAFVRSHDMYAGTEVVYSLKIDQVTLNTSMPESEFAI